MVRRMGQNLSDVRFRLRFSSSPNESFLPKSFLSLHFLGSSGVMIGSKFTALAQKEARRGERE
jgi:hypothetical protein